MSGASLTIFIIFLLLKVFHVVTWSWWIITLPLWLGFAIWGGVFVFALILGVIANRK